MTDRTHTPLSLLTAISVLTVAASPIFLPAMPATARDLDAAIGDIQLTLSSFLVAYALSMLVVGPLSDHFGRKPLLIGGLALFAAASAASACAQSGASLIFARGLQGAGACVGLVLIRAVINDTRSREDTARTLSLIAIALALTQPSASLLGGELLGFFGWRSGFALTFVLSLPLILWCHQAVAIDSTRNSVSRGHSVANAFKNYAVLLTNRQYIVYALVISGGWAAFHCFNAAAPVILIENYRLPPSHYGYFAIIPSAGYLIGSACVGRLSTAIGTDRMIPLGCACNLMAGILILVFAVNGAYHWAYVIGPTFFIGLGNSLILPSSSSGSMRIFPSMAGAAAALSGFIQMAFGGLGAAATAVTSPVTETKMGLIILGASLFSIIVWVLRGSERTPEHTAQSSAA
jgi:DHA1 family bicyclomycin/chloramphenicol resistance-like MFS transporter